MVTWTHNRCWGGPWNPRSHSAFWAWRRRMTECTSDAIPGPVWALSLSLCCLSVSFAAAFLPQFTWQISSGLQQCFDTPGCKFDFVIFGDWIYVFVGTGKDGFCGLGHVDDDPRKKLLMVLMGLRAERFGEGLLVERYGFSIYCRLSRVGFLVSDSWAHWSPWNNIESTPRCCILRCVSCLQQFGVGELAQVDGQLCSLSSLFFLALVDMRI